MFTSSFENDRPLSEIIAVYDYVIVGGGLTGVCNAITAARAGLRVALVQDRPVLGGNSSSEIRIWALGATSHMGNNNRWSREGGIIDEIMVENTFRNKEGNPVLYDAVLMDKVLAEKNITLYLNTIVYSVRKSDRRKIENVLAFNPQNSTKYTIFGQLFADCSGDGIVSYLSGASFRMGAEDMLEYNERFAPDKKEYGELLGHSILFYYKDAGKPIKFVAPEFALKNAAEHIPKLDNPNYFNVNQHGCKYWWLEYGGRIDTIGDTEKIKFEIWKVVYGVWDYIKNSGKFPQAENLTLDWVGLISGKRESRRFKGYYMMTQQDVIEQHEHYDAVAYGGWSIDLHPSDGVYSALNGCNQWHSKGVYQIPYRCYVTPDLDNLFLGGRIISASHVANGSTRVMCTAAHGGQAIGMAAAMCIKNGLKPADYIDKERIKYLQAELIKTGHFIPEVEIGDGKNLLDSATISCSSELQLSSLPEGKSSFRLDYPAAQMIPVEGRVPKILFKATAAKPTSLRVELRSSSIPQNFTPDVTDAVIETGLKEGVNIVEIDFGKAYDSSRYVFVCLMTNPDVVVPMSDKLVSGLVSVFNYINPAVSNYGKQSPPEGIGVEAFEFWCPKRRPEGQNFAMSFDPSISLFGCENLRNLYFRPYLHPNGWIAAAQDNTPELTLKWSAKQNISSVRLFFDTDFDHAMENVQMGHHDNAMPFCIKDYTVYDRANNVIAEVAGNHQSINDIHFDEVVQTDLLKIEFKCDNEDVYPALMGLIVE